jgi:hypothetical protein
MRRLRRSTGPMGVSPRAGEELLIPGGASHTVRNVGDTESRWLFGYER